MYPKSEKSNKVLMTEKQRTLAKEVSLTGKGLHTGITVTITFKPAPANHGYKFCRTDLPGKPVIDALAENVTDTSRGTTLVPEWCFSFNN